MQVSSTNLYSQNIAFHGSKPDKKHPIKATMSMFAPGTGQVLNGDIFKGIGYASVASAVDAVSGFLTLGAVSAISTKAKNPLAMVAAAALSIMTSLFIHISSAKDAYRGGKKS